MRPFAAAIVLLAAGAAPIALAAAAARAGEVPLYQKAPDWVVPAALPDLSKGANTLPPLLVFDSQMRIENGEVWRYVDTATRIASAEQLGQQSSLTTAWVPDKGDLIVHRVEILRGSETIDVIARGQKFDVLRREENLEQRSLTGILTGVMAVQGLQIGDILRVTLSTTTRDSALAGRAQALAGLPVAPLKLGFGRARLLWPKAAMPKVQMLASGLTPKQADVGGYGELTWTLPAPKQPEIPRDAPGRFKKPPQLEVSTFTGWDDVSRVMEPLYRTKGLIAADHPLRAEIAAIMAATPDPLQRTQRALELVQDKIRYLAVGMNGGNYQPQSPAQTWTLRYGDCKAKTLLLLALLHEMGITAEPVLANLGEGDIVSVRLPSAAAFNHILVRATVNGETLWLDGTGSGSRLADIHDTPPLYNVLPLRPDGAGLMPVAMHADGRPGLDISIASDESTSPDLPRPFTVTAVFSGGIAGQLALIANQLGPKERAQLATRSFKAIIGDALYADVRITPDTAAGTTTVTARGVGDSDWERQDKRLKLSVAKAVADMNFAPDRARTAWAAIPVSTGNPQGVRWQQSLRLPDAGRGYRIDGTADFNGPVAGRQYRRTLTLANGLLGIDERLDATGAEIPVSAIAAARNQLAAVKSQAPRLVAPEGVPRSWDVSAKQAATSTQVKAIDAVLATNIATDPEEVAGLVVRADLRTHLGDLKGARADLDAAIALKPTLELYLARAELAQALGDLKAATADAEAAQGLDPAAGNVINILTDIKSEVGDLDGALAIIDERIAQGGETRSDFRTLKASLLADFGDAAAAVQIMDEEVTANPGKSQLYNSRCYIKATRNLMLESALEDCNKALAMNNSPAATYDSRAMVYFRQGKLDLALADLNTALDLVPGLDDSRFMRAIVLAKLGRAAEAGRDLAIARRVNPHIDAQFGRYGVKASGIKPVV